MKSASVLIVVLVLYRDCTGVPAVDYYQYEEDEAVSSTQRPSNEDVSKLSTTTVSSGFATTSKTYEGVYEDDFKEAINTTQKPNDDMSKLTVSFEFEITSETNEGVNEENFREATNTTQRPSDDVSKLAASSNFGTTSKIYEGVYEDDFREAINTTQRPNDDMSKLTTSNFKISSKFHKGVYDGDSRETVSSVTKPSDYDASSYFDFTSKISTGLYRLLGLNRESRHTSDKDDFSDAMPDNYEDEERIGVGDVSGTYYGNNTDETFMENTNYTMDDENAIQNFSQMVYINETLDCGSDYEDLNADATTSRNKFATEVETIEEGNAETDRTHVDTAQEESESIEMEHESSEFSQEITTEPDPVTEHLVELEKERHKLLKLQRQKQKEKQIQKEKQKGKQKEKGNEKQKPEIQVEVETETESDGDVEVEKSIYEDADPSPVIYYQEPPDSNKKEVFKNKSERLLESIAVLSNFVSNVVNVAWKSMGLFLNPTKKF